MTILLHKAKAYLLSKSNHEGKGGGVKIPKILATWFMDDPLPIIASGQLGIYPTTRSPFLTPRAFKALEYKPT